MADLTAFDIGSTTNPGFAMEQLVLLLNRQGFLERSIVTPLRDRFEYGRDLSFFARSDTTTFETHACPYNYTTDALTTVTQAKDVLIAVPFVAGDAFSKNLISFEVTTGAGANGRAHVGIYAATYDLNGTPYPGSLIVSGITAQDVTGTGVKTGTIAWSPTYGRLYFAAYLAGTNAPAVRSVPTTNMRPALGFPATLGTAPQYGYTVASTYNAGGLPSTYPAGATAITSGAIPAIFLRSSSVQTVTRYIPAFSPSSSGYYLRRVKAWSAAGTTTSGASAYFTITPSIRSTAYTSSLGTFDTRTARMAAGEPYYFGGQAEIDLPIPVDAILETKVVAVGWPSETLQDVVVQWDYAFTGGG